MLDLKACCAGYGAPTVGAQGWARVVALPDITLQLVVKALGTHWTLLDPVGPCVAADILLVCDHFTPTGIAA